MRVATILLAGLMAPGLAHAIDCSIAAVPQALPVRPTMIAPIAFELSPASSQLGASGSVLSQAYDEAQSVDQVLLRLRIEGCQNVAMAVPAPSVVDPNDPATYKKQTEFDNTPWRFDMSQNGKRMTADEFSAWMKSRGVRVARGRAPTAVPIPAPASSGQPPTSSTPVLPAPMPPSTVPAPATQPSTPPDPPQP